MPRKLADVHPLHPKRTPAGERAGLAQARADIAAAPVFEVASELAEILSSPDVEHRLEMAQRAQGRGLRRL